MQFSLKGKAVIISARSGEQDVLIFSQVAGESSLKDPVNPTSSLKEKKLLLASTYNKQ